jgi:hypothetical protein
LRRQQLTVSGRTILAPESRCASAQSDGAARSFRAPPCEKPCPGFEFPFYPLTPRSLCDGEPERCARFCPLTRSCAAVGDHLGCQTIASNRNETVWRRLLATAFSVSASLSTLPAAIRLRGSYKWASGGRCFDPAQLQQFCHWAITKFSWKIHVDSEPSIPERSHRVACASKLKTRGACASHPTDSRAASMHSAASLP